MENSNQHSSNRQLNPFAFPAETDFRFLLLVLAIAGATLSLGDTTIGAFTENDLFAFLVSLGLLILIFKRAWSNSRKDAKARIKKGHWKFFPIKSTEPMQKHSFKQMEQYILETVAQIPDLDNQSLDFVWDDTSEQSNLPTGMAFGFGKRQYICLRQGLHQAFIQLSKCRTFPAILLHELGHIVNRDVSKTIFSVALTRCLIPVATILIVILDAYLVFHSLRRFIQGDSLYNIWEGARFIFAINFNAILLLLLIRLIRNSILRIREYYADVRACIWLGNSEPLLQQFIPEKSDSKAEKAKKQLSPLNSTASQGLRRDVWQAFTSIWMKFKHYFQTYIAPTHPTSEQRAATVRDFRNLFKPSYEVAFISSFLTGIALNSNLTIHHALEQLVILVNTINENAQQLEPINSNYYYLFFLFIIMLIMFLIYVLGVLAIFAIFGLVPIVGTTGLQIQQASFADHLQPSLPPLLPLRKVMNLAFILGIGIVLGVTFSPAFQAFSFPYNAPLLVVGYIFGWTFVFFLWMLPLRWIACHLYIRHTGDKLPKKKQRWLTILSGIALFPLFVFMAMTQIFLSARTVYPAGSFPIDNLEGLLVLVGVLAFILSGFVWAVGCLLMLGLGWLRPVDHNTSERSWTCLPVPISFPAPPASMSKPTFIPTTPPPL